MADAQEQSQQFANITINDLIYAQVKDLGKRMDRLENRMDKIESRMDKFDEKLDTTRKELNARMDKFEARMDKQDEKIEKLADKIDALRDEIIFSKNRDNVMTVAVVVIALTVIYAVFIK